MIWYEHNIWYAKDEKSGGRIQLAPKIIFPTGNKNCLHYTYTNVREKNGSRISNAAIEFTSATHKR